jgi:hypothetical protein
MTDTNWDVYIDDAVNDNSVRVKMTAGDTGSDITVMRQSDLDKLQEANDNLYDTVQNQQTIIDNLNNTISALNKTIFIDLRTNALYHNGSFGIFAYNLKGEGVTGATVTLKMVWNSGKSTSTVNMVDKGGGVYQKDNFLGNNSNLMIHCYITLVKDDVTVRRYYEIYMD